MRVSRRLFTMLPVALAVTLLAMGGSASAARTTMANPRSLPTPLPVASSLTTPPPVGATVPGYADVIWQDKSTETISIGDVPAGASPQQLLNAAAPAIAARAKAEGRPVPPGSPGTTNAGRRAHDDEDGIYYCVAELYGPAKDVPNVEFAAGISCSLGVEETQSEVYLYRGAHYDYLIGYNATIGWSAETNGTYGPCAPSTWTYIGDLDYTMSSPYGDKDFDHEMAHGISC